MNDIRIDKYLWAVRLYKTRSVSATAIKTEQVLLNDRLVKSAQTIKIGDIIKVKRNPIWRSYRVIELLKRRVGAKLVPEYIIECTPKEEIEKFEMMKLMPGFDRQRGTGRPTKKERRDLEGFDEW